MILLIDNYDSFTYNLVQRIGELDPSIDLRVFRNDKIDVDQALALKPDHLIISPGPCTPREGGISNAMIEAFAGRVPLLGVCLGHQCIGFTHGMTVKRHYRLMHGKTSAIHHDDQTIFAGLSNPFIATRYHSLIVERETVPTDKWQISAWTEEGEVMGLRLKDSPTPVEGVQFHPESFLTEEGPILLANFLGLPRPQVVRAEAPAGA
jgi:anthranilate synthase/aminodeoxychorismate synthase-like glutamine amidotransferase